MADVAECFMCEIECSISEIWQTMTKQMKYRFNSSALALQDKSNLAKLSSGDAIAQELKYHLRCLTVLSNRKMEHLNEKCIFIVKRMTE
jgi:hypothetical protein